MISQAAGAPRELRSCIRRLQELPPLSASSQQLLDALSREDLEIADLATLVEQSPPLAARVIDLAGSAYFGRNAPLRSVTDAIVRVLGLKLVKNLLLGIVLSGPLNTGRISGFSSDQYWASALLAANFARLVTPTVRAEQRPASESAYLCGLLHNIGLLALVHVAPKEMSEVLAAASNQPARPLTEIETEHLGLHHCDAGAWLAHRWHLPAEVGIVIEHHHDKNYRGPEWTLSLLVGLGVRWGRQCLARVEQPWIPTDALRSLGIKEPALAKALAECESGIQEIAGLGKLLAK